MNSKVKKKITKNSFISDFKLSLNLNEINEKNPINNLITSFHEIQSIIDDNNPNPDKIKIIYFNKNKIHRILYDSDEMITLSSNIIKNNISHYFYIMLLLKDNENIVNYTYSIDFIKNINAELNNNNNKLKSLIISKLIIDLIKNYNGEDEKELKQIEDNNLTIIKNNLKELEQINIKLDEKTIMKSKIDKIYIDILNILIEQNKINDELLNELDLENINITKTMFEELSKILEKNKNKYKIQEEKDLFDDDKINFYYILFKYIFKNQIYLYHVPFLREAKKQIIKIIKNKSKEFSFNKLKNIRDKLIQIIDYFTDSKYYSNKYLNNNNNNNRISTTINSINNNNSSILSVESSSTFQTTIQNQNTNIEEDYAILKFEQIIDKNPKSNSAKYIKELSNGYFVIGGQNDYLTIYRKNFSILGCYMFGKKEEKSTYYKFQQNIMETNENIKNKDNQSIQVLDCSKFALMLNTITIKNNTIDVFTQKSFEYSCTGCYEYNNNNNLEYIVIGEKGILHFNEFPDKLKTEEKILDKFNMDKKKRNYKGNIKINENILALTSNSVLPKGEDIIIFYNMSNKNIISDCQNYSFINGVNGLSIMDLEKENKKVLLCACKKYTKNQKNGILLINAKTEEYQQLNTNFLDTDSFEVNCFCQISIKENNETIKTNYFLVGGLDTQKRQGIIKLCKITNNNNKFNIEFVEDIFISYIKGFEGFQQTISCIVQSTKNGKILVGCCDGKVYSFSQPNINMYLEEDKELEELDNQSTSEINYN